MAESRRMRSELTEARAREQSIRSNFRIGAMLLGGPALARLARIARGDTAAIFNTSHELQACFALARLATQLAADRAADSDGAVAEAPSILPDLTDEELTAFNAYFDGERAQLPAEVLQKIDQFHTNRNGGVK